MLLKIHAVIALLVAIDYALKAWAVAALKGKETIILINGLLGLTYVENRGAAFGIFSGKQTMLIILSVAIIAVLEYYLIKEKPKSPLVLSTITLVIAGGLGNLIDRVIQGYVVDYIDVNQLFSFPMFNFADCCVTVGEALIILIIVMSEVKERKEKKLLSEKLPDEEDGNEQ